MPLTTAQRLARLESVLGDVTATIDALVDVHNVLDTRFEDLHYRLLYVMHVTRLRKKLAVTLVTAPGAPEHEEGSLEEFWSRDGAKFIADLKAQADAIERKIEGAAAIREAVADTLSDLKH